MESKEFSRIRHYLGKSQSQMAKLLCVSSKAVQSFEQGWRDVPAAVERHLLFLLSLKMSPDQSTCWEIRNCPDELREKCPAWEFQAGYLCWFVSGTFCNGQSQDNWKKKIALCRQCEVFRHLLPGLPG